MKIATTAGTRNRDDRNKTKKRNVKNCGIQMKYMFLIVFINNILMQGEKSNKCNKSKENLTKVIICFY